MVGLGSGAITPYRIHRLLALIRTSRVFSLEVSRHTKRAGPLRRAASVESTCGRNGFRRGDSDWSGSGLRERFELRFAAGRNGYRRDAPNPYLTVGLGRHEAGRDCGTDCNLAVRHDSWESIVCHAVEAHRFPKHRPFIPGVHPASGSLSYGRARVRGNHALSNPSSPGVDTNFASLLS